MVRSPYATVPWTPVHRTKVAITSSGCTWHLLTIMATTDCGEGTNNCFSFRKDYLRTNPTTKEAKQLKAMATVRFRHNCPHEQHGFMSTFVKERTIEVQ